MSEEQVLNPMALRRVVCEIPQVDVRVEKDLSFPASDGTPRAFDLYRPSGTGSSLPCVVLVAGYPDEGFKRILGCSFKDMGWSESWARLLAASGVAAATYSNREPVSDARELIRHLAENSTSLGLNGSISLFASSGNAPLALSLAGDRELFPCRRIALCYPYTCDTDGHTAVRDAAQQFRFACPSPVDVSACLPAGLPLFIARAGRDEMPGLNASLDRFIGAALNRNLPVTLVNHSEGRHAFDLDDDSEATREVVQQLVGFLKLA